MEFQYEESDVFELSFHLKEKDVLDSHCFGGQRKYMMCPAVTNQSDVRLEGCCRLHTCGLPGMKARSSLWICGSSCSLIAPAIPFCLGEVTFLLVQLYQGEQSCVHFPGIRADFKAFQWGLCLPLCVCLILIHCKTISWIVMSGIQTLLAHELSTKPALLWLDVLKIKQSSW